MVMANILVAVAQIICAVAALGCSYRRDQMCSHAVGFNCTCSGCQGLYCSLGSACSVHCACSACAMLCPGSHGSSFASVGGGGGGGGSGGSTTFVRCICGWQYSGPAVPYQCQICGRPLGYAGSVYAAGGSGGGRGSSSGGGGGSGAYSFGAYSPGMIPPSVPVHRRPGPSAGIDGFAGLREAEFDLALGCVRGLRKWTVQGFDAALNPAGLTADWEPGLLTGSTGYQWAPGLRTASCNYSRFHWPPVDIDPASGFTCGCGFWAYFEHSPVSWMQPGGRLTVEGIIAGTGRTIFGELGFRCEQARIVALAVPKISPVTGEYFMSNGRIGQRVPSPVARQRADAWMGVIQDRLQLVYPDVQVFTGRATMLAAVPLGEIPPG
jgi:hypothetical protein